MIIWNKVTWYSKLSAIIFFIGIVPLLAFYIGYKYQETSDVLSSPIFVLPQIKHQDKQNGDYSYRCGDGTEFSVKPSLDMSTLYITPVSSADYLSRVILTQTESKAGVKYEGSGVTFLGQGEAVKLTAAKHPTTNCSPLPNDDMAPLNFGD